MIGQCLLNPLIRLALSLLAIGIILISVGITSEGEKPSCLAAYIGGFLLGCSFGVSSVMRYMRDVTRNQSN